MYRIKQDYVNYNSCSTCFRQESLRLYHYAGNNPVRYIDPDGKQQFPSGLKDIFNFLYIAGDPYSKIYNEMKLADSGDEYAKAYLKYAFHEAGRETLKLSSATFNDMAIISLCVGLPEGTAAFSTISTVCDAVLVIDDFLNGNFSEAKKGAVIIIAGIVTSKVLKESVSTINAIHIVAGETGKIYNIGRKGSLKSEIELVSLIMQDIDSGYFGDQVISNAPLIIQEVKKAYEKIKEENNE